MTQNDRAERPPQLHRGGAVLLLPNARDAVSARIAETEGFAAVATSSAGCGAVLGTVQRVNAYREAGADCLFAAKRSRQTPTLAKSRIC
jgi:2-methylisocitrate lyase-like PEP mutase family enzyme